jgi:hypothetical protein
VHLVGVQKWQVQRLGKHFKLSVLYYNCLGVISIKIQDPTNSGPSFGVKNAIVLYYVTEKVNKNASTPSLNSKLIYRRMFRQDILENST